MESLSSQIVDLSCLVLVRFLTNTFLFRNRPEEVLIWLKSLKTMPSNQCENTIHWIDTAFCSGMRGPYRIVDRMNELIKSSLPNDSMNIWSRCSSHVSASKLTTIQWFKLNAPNLFIDREYYEEADDFSDFFPFAPALICVADGLAAIAKIKHREDSNITELTNTPLVLAASQFFFINCYHLIHATQGASDFILHLVNAVLTTAGVASDEINRCPSFEKLYHADILSPQIYLESLKIVCLHFKNAFEPSKSFNYMNSEGNEGQVSCIDFILYLIFL